MADVAARANRADEVRTERRRKPGSTVQYGQKLGVEEEFLDRQTYTYRFVNDVGGRVQAMERNDWDVAPMGEASVESRHVGVDSGHPQNAILMRKRKDWHENDQKEARKPLDEMEQAIRKGTAHATQPGSDADLNASAYTPGTGNSITR
jgi:hypothetical protein